MSSFRINFNFSGITDDELPSSDELMCISSANDKLVSYNNQFYFTLHCMEPYSSSHVLINFCYISTTLLLLSLNIYLTGRGIVITPHDLRWSGTLTSHLMKEEFLEVKRMRSQYTLCPILYLKKLVSCQWERSKVWQWERTIASQC